MNKLMEGGNILFAGYNAAHAAECMREKAAYLQNIATKYQEQWKNAINGEGDLSVEIKEEMAQSLNDMSKINAEYTLAKRAYKSNLKSIQVVGIAMLVFVFFMLLLKTYGLLAPLGHALAWPFEALFRMLKSEV